MSRARMVTTALTLAGTIAFAAPALGADAGSISETGWWSRRPGAAPEIDGAFEVARGPDAEDLSVAAIRIDVTATTIFRAVLSLGESGGTLQERAVLNVCRTAAEWAGPANPGAMDDAPQPDCESGAVALRRDAASSRWTADINILLSGGPGQRSVMVVTDAPEAPLPVDPGFRVTFSGAQLLSEGSTALPAPASEAPAPPPAADEPATVALRPPAPAPPAPVPAANPPVQAAPVQPDGSFPTQPLSDDEGTPKPWWRLAIFVPLSIVLAAAAARARHVLAARAG